MFEYRKVFVKFEQQPSVGPGFYVNVTNDGWHKGYFYSEATTQEEFERDCEAYTETDKFKESMLVAHGS